MCGISGIVSSKNIVENLLTSMRNLEYRGYDSCGIALMNAGRLEIRKNTGTVDEVNAKEQLSSMEGHVGIAHTRWATHGGVTKVNSHPHLSANEKFVIVHNGIFSNYQDLKAELQQLGIQFRSMTDSEVFAHLVELAYRETQNLENSFLKALSRVEGSFAITMLTEHDPEHIYCAKQDSPLVIGLGEDTNYIGSDINAFLEYTHKVVTMDDGEYGLVSKNGYVIKSVKTREVVNKKVTTIQWDIETTKKGGYSHYMLKEIFDQPHTINQALKIPLPDIQRVAQMILEAKTCYLMGVGTTFYVGLVGQYYFNKLVGRYFPCVSSDEFNDIAILHEGDLLLAISQSGETYDTKMGVQFAKAKGAKTAGIVNVMGSTISMMVDQVIMQGSGPEICVVSTKAALAQMFIILRLAIEGAKISGRMSAEEYKTIYQALEDFPDLIQNTLNEQSGFLRNMARGHSKMHNWLFLGCGQYFPIALESSLKMKEVTYLHSEGMAGGFLKHGTLAMIDEHIYSLFFIPPPEDTALNTRTLVAIHEIKARGGRVLGFMFQGDAKAESLLDHAIRLPKVHPLVAPLLQIIMAQLFAYYTALDLGRNIDKPRNLAKSVTVG